MKVKFTLGGLGIISRVVISVVASLVIGFSPFFYGLKAAWAQDGSLPFSPGEKLIFELKWTVVKAGEAVVEVMPFESVNGEKAYHFVMTVKSTPFIDKVYKVRDRIDAYCDVEMSRSLLFKKKQREGRSKRDIVVTFDWDKQQAQYANFGEKQNPISILPGSFDPYIPPFSIQGSMIGKRAVKSRDR